VRRISPARQRAHGAVRRQLGLLIRLVVAVDVVFFGLYLLADLGRAAPGVKLGFTVVWTVATLAVVLPRLSRIRELRRRR
jgi:hypothetical protein